MTVRGFAVSGLKDPVRTKHERLDPMLLRTQLLGRKTEDKKELTV